MSNFLGVGFKFPFTVGPNGGIQLSKYESNIEESVRVIIGTALGERQMRPEWGCRIHDFVFAPNNTSRPCPIPTRRNGSWSTFVTRSGRPTASTTSSSRST